MIIERSVFVFMLTALLFFTAQGQVVKKDTNFNLGITLKPFVFEVPAGTEAEFLLINNPHINRIECYRNEQAYYRSGDQLPFSKRPFPVRYFVFPLDSSKNTLHNFTFILDKKAENLSGRIQLLTARELEATLKYEQRLIGGIVGCLLIIFSIVFIMILVSREINGFFFLIYIFSSVLWILNDAGFFYQYLWPNSPKFHQLSRTIFSTTSLSAYVFMIIIQYKPRFSKSLKIFLACFLFFIVLRTFFLFFRVQWTLNEEDQLVLLQVNSIVLLALFCYLFYILYYKVLDTSATFFEKTGIFLYWILVVSLSLHQLGFDLFGRHQHKAELLYLFFVLQIITIALGMILSYHKKRVMLEKEKQLILMNQQKLINETVLSVQDLERNRIGRSLHDEVGSLLSSIKFIIAKISSKTTDPLIQSDLSDANQLVTQTIEKKYQIVHDILLPDFSINSLKQMILERIKYFSSESGIHFDVAMIETIALPEKCTSTLYKIIIELINNTIKHTQAHNIRIALVENLYDLVLEYLDDGQGFNIEETIKEGGLRSFLYNVQSLFGTYTAKSDKNGTFYRVIIKKEVQ